MRILKTNLLMSLRILICAFAFLITIVVGAILEADPLRLLLSSVFVYVFFYILSGVVVKILDRLHEETEIRARGSEDVHVDEDRTGQFLDMTQKAEMPFES
jgi:hypothetical protein